MTNPNYLVSTIRSVRSITTLLLTIRPTDPEASAARQKFVQVPAAPDLRLAGRAGSDDEDQGVLHEQNYVMILYVLANMWFEFPLPLNGKIDLCFFFFFSHLLYCKLLRRWYLSRERTALPRLSRPSLTSSQAISFMRSGLCNAVSTRSNRIE